MDTIEHSPHLAFIILSDKMILCLQKRREECERKARRGEMDPRLEFAFQLLMDATQLSRHKVMDHVFEGDMLDEINQLFVPHMRSTLMWYYQEVEEPEPPTDTVQERHVF